MMKKLTQVNTNNSEVVHSPACLQYLKLAQSRKRAKLTHIEYEQLRLAYIHYHFNQHPEINRSFFARWRHANEAEAQLNNYLELMGIIVLPEQILHNLHEFNLSGTGFIRLTSLVRKIKLNQKIK
jgi:hypothetical protein